MNTGSKVTEQDRSSEDVKIPAWFPALKTFFENKPASRKALAHLKEGVEISLVVDTAHHCALLRDGTNPAFELRTAHKPDVQFIASLAAIERLVVTPANEVGALGIDILREIKNQQIHIKVPGSLWNITLNGYLGIVKEGGAEFAKFLAQNGVANIAKIPALIKNLKEKK